MSFTEGRHCLGCHMSLKNCKCEENDMTPQEANRIIAEYMGDKSPVPVNLHELSEKQLRQYLPYAHSLDALVPVWEKARIFNVCQFDFNRLGNSYEFTIFQDRPDKEYGNQWYAKESTVQEAAALATAKAIKELKNE